MEDIKITYSIELDKECVRFQHVNELSAEQLLILKKKTVEFEKKLKEASALYLLKKRLSQEQLEQLKIEFQSKKTESLPT